MVDKVPQVTPVDFSAIASNIDSEYERLNKQCSELQEMLNQARAERDKLVSLKAVIEGRSVSKTRKLGTRKVTPEGKALKGAGRSLAAAKKRGDQAEIKRLTAEVKRLKADYDAMRAKKAAAA